MMGSYSLILGNIGSVPLYDMDDKEFIKFTSTTFKVSGCPFQLIPQYSGLIYSKPLLAPIFKRFYREPTP
jgi:hypothetical protein